MKPLPESESSKLEQSATSTEGDGSTTITSSQPQQNVPCHHQEAGSSDDNSPEIPSSNSHVIQVESGGGNGDPAASSGQVPQPNCGQDSAERERYQELYRAAKDGKWKKAKKILESNDKNELLRADLTNRNETILHVATQANQTGFVRQLLNYLTDTEIQACLESEDVNGTTAFIFAVASGNMKIIKIMGKNNPDLLLKKTSQEEQYTPLYIAAFQEKSEIARYLYKSTSSENFNYELDDLKLLFFLCVNAGIYDLAFELLKKEQDLAFKTDDKGETVLHILSRKPLGSKKTQQYKLVSHLWNNIFLTRSHSEIIGKISRPTHVVFNAAEVGNFRFLELLISTYPYLVWEIDEWNRSIIHIAVLHRQADIFNFARGIGSIKYILARYLYKKDESGEANLLHEDESNKGNLLHKDKYEGNLLHEDESNEGNLLHEDESNEGNLLHEDEYEGNLLHMAATLIPKDQPNLVFGAAFQMTLELLWFEAVKKIVPPSFIEMKNSEGFTPHQLFTKSHIKLVDKAQSWTKKTAHCCMLVSTLITAGVFTATFSVPGGNKDDTGSPHYLEDDKMWFMIFSIFDAITMISSSTSIFIFVSILISRHAEHDFHYRSLPMKLIFGLITLLISIISMMASFSSAFIMYYNAKTLSHGAHDNVLNWVPTFICVLSFIPIPIFVYLLWPLWSDIGKLTKFSWNLS